MVTNPTHQTDSINPSGVSLLIWHHLKLMVIQQKMGKFNIYLWLLTSQAITINYIYIQHILSTLTCDYMQPGFATWS